VDNDATVRRFLRMVLSLALDEYDACRKVRVSLESVTRDPRNTTCFHDLGSRQ